MSATKTASGIAVVVALVAVFTAGYEIKARHDSARSLASVISERDSLQKRLTAAQNRVVAPNANLVSGKTKPANIQETGESAWQIGSPVNYALDHSEARAAFIEKEVQRAKSKFSRFFNSTGLSADEVDKFLAVIANFAQAKLDLTAEIRAQGYGPYNVPQDADAYYELFKVDAEVDSEYMNDLHAMFSDDIYQQFVAYRKSIPVLNLTDALASQLSNSGNPLTTQQADQMAQDLKMNPFSAAPVPSAANTMNGFFISNSTLSNAMAESNIVNGDIMMPSLDWQAAVTDAAIAGAESVLTPAQLAVLRQMQAQQVIQFQTAPPTPPQPDILELVRQKNGG
jgi:hypothetical protein